VTIGELLADLERRAADAEAIQAIAPVAVTLRRVVAELTPLMVPRGVRLDAASADDRLLTVTEAAARLCVTPRWLYVHADDFPFTVRLPGRRLRFRALGLASWLDRHRP